MPHRVEASEAEKKHHMGHRQMLEDFKRRFIVSTILTIPIIVLSPTIQSWIGITIYLPFADYILLILSSVVFFYGGKPFIVGLIKEIRTRRLGMMTLIGLAISVAYFYSVSVILYIGGKTFFWELATLIDIMLLGHYIEMKSVMRASMLLEKLAKLIPSVSHLVTEDDSIIDIPTDKLIPGNIVLVKPGERIPTDGTIIEGQTSIDESMLTGESTPIFKSPGSEVIASSVNLDGTIKIRVERVGKETYLAQVMRIVGEAQKSKSRTQLIADRAAFFLTLIAIFAGVLTFIVWIYLLNSPVFALERMVTVMVITCPHALGLAIPLAVAVSSSLAASKGFIIRNREAFEMGREIDIVVFDKTGTLTKGEFEVKEVIPANNYDIETVIKYAASLEVGSSHPIALAIVRYAEKLGIEVKPAKDMRTIPGVGVEGVVDGEKYIVAGANYLRGREIEIPTKDIEEMKEKGYTVVYLISNDKIVGAIGLADALREESFEAIKILKSMGLKCMMITGDNAKVAKRVAKELGLDYFKAEVLPHEKAEIIKQLQKEGESELNFY